MRTFLFFLLLIVFHMNSSAQTEGSSRLYGYVQPVLPGANNTVIVEGGEQVTEPKKTGKNYRIYIESTSRVYPVEIWIKGEPFSARMDVISSTPVEFGADVFSDGFCREQPLEHYNKCCSCATFGRRPNGTGGAPVLPRIGE